MSKKSKNIKKNKTEQSTYTEERKIEIDRDFQELQKKYDIKDGYQPKIQNVVSTVFLESPSGEPLKLDLDKIANKSTNCEYKKTRFPALIQRITQPKSTALIFEAGKMVITGTKSQKDAEQAAEQFKKNIEKQDNKTSIKEIQTSNIVANSQLTYKVNLTNIHNDSELKGSISYDRQSFPGLIYKMQNPKLAALIFYSGKIVFTGAKNEHQIREAYIQLFNILKKHESSKMPL